VWFESVYMLYTRALITECNIKESGWFWLADHDSFELKSESITK